MQNNKESINLAIKKIEHGKSNKQPSDDIQDQMTKQPATWKIKWTTDGEHKYDK